MIFKEKVLFDASFDKYAKNYDNIRPKYPKELFEDIFRETNLRKGKKVLEIGAGSGIATKHLASKGADVIAVEPGENLSKVLQLNLSEYDNVKVITETFEKINVDNKKFDLIVSATAFHWIKGEDELEKFNRTEQMLKDDGYLVLFWNSFCRQESSLTEKIDLIYKEELSDVYPIEKSVNLKVLNKIINREKEIINNDCFYLIQIKRYQTNYAYNAEEYINLLNTYPKIINLNKVRKEKFFEKIHNIIKNNGDKIIIPVLSSLYILKKKASFSDDISL